MDGINRLGGQISLRLPAVLGPGANLINLQPVSGGASLETYVLDVRTTEGGERRLVLRRESPTEPRPDGMAREAAALRAAGRQGVPVPEVLDVGTDSATLGAPYLVMDFVPGETIARRILRDDAYGRARSTLAGALGTAAARIHRVPAAEVALLPHVDVLAELEARYAATGALRPVLEVAFRWLHAHRPDHSDRLVLVHGDFRLGNVIVDADGLASVLDWELAHMGDPMEDLGYLCVRAWRFGGPLPVAGVGTFRQLFDAYDAEAGVRPDPEVVFWWQVVGTLRWAIGCLAQAHRHLSGATRSVELAAIGRRVAEQEQDLLRMTGAGDRRVPHPL